MYKNSETPFDSIEDAQGFVTLLSRTVSEVKLQIEADVVREQNFNVPRRVDALRMILYTLEKLEHNMNRSKRALNDLRTLRRLLFEERNADAAKPQHDRSNGKAALSGQERAAAAVAAD